MEVLVLLELFFLFAQALSGLFQLRLEELVRALRKRRLIVQVLFDVERRQAKSVAICAVLGRVADIDDAKRFFSLDLAPWMSLRIR